MTERGRPKGANGEESRALLLTIAANEFAANGYHKTKISTIVQRASLTQPTFYLYFKNKAAILEELEDLFQSKLQQFITNSYRQLDVSTSTLSNRLIRFFQNILEFLVHNPDLTIIGLYTSEQAEKQKSRLIQLIKEKIQFEKQAGHLRSDLDVQFTAECLLGTIERLACTQLFIKQKSPKQLATEIVHLQLYGILETHAITQLQNK